MISTYDLSERQALLFTTAHEIDNRDLEGHWGTSDNKIDLHNNFIGAEVGRAVLQWKQQDPSRKPLAYDMTVKMVYILAINSNSCSTCLNLLGGYN
jgi:hypothetical protein